MRATARTRRLSLRLATLAASALVLVGCQSSLESENAALFAENADLRDQQAEKDRALDEAYFQLREKDERIAQLQTDLAQKPEVINPFGDIPGVTGSASAGEVTATLASDVLFDAGKATLKSSAKQTLARVARVIRSEYPGNTVRVAGHTDTDPIRKSGHKSNYHLGFERAYAVRTYLIEQGLRGDEIYIASHGPDQAKGSKAESRRVEIVVVLDR